MFSALEEEWERTIQCCTQEQQLSVVSSSQSSLKTNFLLVSWMENWTLKQNQTMSWVL